MTRATSRRRWWDSCFLTARSYTRACVCASHWVGVVPGHLFTFRSHPYQSPLFSFPFPPVLFASDPTTGAIGTHELRTTGVSKTTPRPRFIVTFFSFPLFPSMPWMWLASQQRTGPWCFRLWLESCTWEISVLEKQETTPLWRARSVSELAPQPVRQRVQHFQWGWLLTLSNWS